MAAARSAKAKTAQVAQAQAAQAAEAARAAMDADKELARELQAMEEAGAALHEEGPNESHLGLAAKDDIISDLRAQLQTSKHGEEAGRARQVGLRPPRSCPSRAGRSGFVNSNFRICLTLTFGFVLIEPPQQHAPRERLRGREAYGR